MLERENGGERGQGDGEIGGREGQHQGLFRVSGGSDNERGEQDRGDALVTVLR